MIEVRDVSVQIGPRTILSGISHAFEPATLTAVIGPNGAGKSTLLRVLAGELAPAHGVALLGGVDIRRLSAAQLARNRAVMPQAAALSFPFTVREVVGLGSSVPGFGIASEDAIVLQAMRAADVMHLEERSYTELSGGERQRVQFARALCQLFASETAPRETALLLDEPTASLDLPHQIVLMRAARAQARAGRTVVAVLHDLNLAAAWADTVIALADGRKLAAGAPLAVFTETTLQRLYGCPLMLHHVPGVPAPIILPAAHA